MPEDISIASRGGTPRVLSRVADVPQVMQPNRPHTRIPPDPVQGPAANIVRNLDEFHEAFATTPRDGLWLDNEERVRIW
jgi:putative endopeptidase